MKTITVKDFLTDKQIKQAIAIYKLHRDDGMLHGRLIALIEPLMPEINRKLGQENDVNYLAYAVEYALSKSEERS